MVRLLFAVQKMTEKVDQAPAIAAMMTLSRSAKYFKVSVNSNMTSESELWKRSLFGSASDGYGQCCPPVFDPYTLLALIGGIALATYFLRLVIINTVFNAPRSLGSSIYGEETFLFIDIS